MMLRIARGLSITRKSETDLRMTQKERRKKKCRTGWIEGDAMKDQEQARWQKDWKDYRQTEWYGADGEQIDRLVIAFWRKRMAQSAADRASRENLIFTLQEISDRDPCNNLNGV